MTSLVAPKPSDNPTAPGQMMALGTDPAALEDFINLDLFSAAPAASRNSQSPASSHGALPATPPSTEQPNSAASPRPLFPPLDGSPGNGFDFLDSYMPIDKNFGAFPDMSLLPSSSMDLGLSSEHDQFNTLFQDMFPGYADPSSSNAEDFFAAAPTATQAMTTPAPVLNSAIDPQLFSATPPPMPAPQAARPSTPPAQMIESDEENSDEDETVHDDDEVAPLPAVSATRRARKNPAAAGGIRKRPSRASTPASTLPSHLNFEDPKPVVPPALGKGGVASYLNGERIGSQEPDEWRPTPEEYKKLSSKEKRQLRNKISARNFRVRRKEYITTLESHIADRDQLISAIRSELSVTHNENNELRREIDALKRAIQQGRLSAADTGLPPPRPLTPEGTPLTPSTPSTTGGRHKQGVNLPNKHKDISGDSSRNNFWGGAIGNGGVTPVHAAIIPEVFPAAPQLSDKRPPTSSPSSSTGPATPPPEGANINPLKNLSPLFGSSKLPSSPSIAPMLDGMEDAFNQRTLEGFRAQLWGRMAREMGARSVERERRETSTAVVETESEPMDINLSDSTPSTSSPASSSSPTPAQPTISSSPSLSMLHSPSGIQSLWSSALAPSNSSSLFGASLFGAGFGTGQPAQSVFSQQNASSAQARAMLQAQWLALQQQSKQPTTATTETQPAGQREAYLAQFAQAVAAQQTSTRPQPQPQPSGLAKDVRPAFFTGEKPKTEQKGATPQQAALFATLASQTIFQRMGSAFWDAFSGKSGVDSDKVRRVLEGKAVVRVVDVDKDLGGLEDQMKKLNVGSGPSTCCTSGGLDMFTNLRGKK